MFLSRVASPPLPLSSELVHIRQSGQESGPGFHVEINNFSRCLLFARQRIKTRAFIMDQTNMATKVSLPQRPCKPLEAKEGRIIKPGSP